jgi:hypothetical protein
LFQDSFSFKTVAVSRQFHSLLKKRREAASCEAHGAQRPRHIK